MPDFSVLEGELGDDLVVNETVRAVTEGVWFGMRTRRRVFRDVQNGVWWTQSGSHIVSLAMGKDLHHHGSVDFETFVFRPKIDLDVCCHDTFDAAENCALTFIRSGHWCR